MKIADGSCIYTIRLEGCLDSRWSEWLDGMSITCTADGKTILRGEAHDQAALYGLLIKLRDLGLPLIEVTRNNDPAVSTQEA
jgi:hypothetical protein